MPTWFGGRRQKQNKRSQKQEKKRAEELGGKTQAGSGSSWRAPQDIKANGILEQLKFTDKPTATVDVRHLRQLLDDAERAGRAPQYTIDFERYGIRLVGAVVTIPGAARKKRTTSES